MKNLRVLMVIIIMCCFWQIATDVHASVLQTKTWTRNELPLIVKAEAIPVLDGETIAEYYLWAYRDGNWEQVVFQVDEMAENTGWEGYTPNPFWNYFIWDDIDNGSDPQAGNGLFSAEDEIVMMGDGLGDQVSTDEWPANVPTDFDRLELRFTDVLHPGDQGWVYLFHDVTSPVWTTEDYVNWIDQEGTEKTVEATGYSMKYASNSPGDWVNSLAIEDLKISTENGGDNTDLWDTQKYSGRVYDSRIPFCQTLPFIETYFQDMNSYRPDYVWGVKDGPVRVIRQYRVRGWLAGDQWGYHPYYTNCYYRTSTHIAERFYINSNGPWTFLEASYDHNEQAIPLTYRDSESRTGLIDGDDSNDSMGAVTAIPDWVLVTSSHGSYHVIFDIDDIEMTGGRTNVWNDGGEGSSEALLIQPANGRYGDFGYRWNDLNVHQNHYIDWYYTFLPSDSPDTEQNGTELYDSYLNPVLSPEVTAQSFASCIHTGDVNMDGDISSDDAQMAFMIALSMVTPTFDEECAADCNGSGSVTAEDSQTIFLAILGLAECEDEIAV